LKEQVKKLKGSIARSEKKLRAKLAELEEVRSKKDATANEVKPDILGLQ